jgi:hypothetical protein
VNLLIQVYEEERVNDHRIAIGFFQAVPIPKPRKDFVLVPSASRNGCELAARHRTPVTGGPLGDFDAHDQRAVFRLLDALVDASFENDEKGRVVALGGGAEPQIDMGTWADGTPVVPLVAGDDPAPARPEEHYRFRRSHRWVWVVRDDIGNAVGE